MNQHYPAEMFRAGSGARASQGRVTVGPTKLTFLDTEGAELIMPLSGLSCRLSGYDNRTFFFAHPSQQGAEIAVKDRSLRDDTTLCQLPIFQEAQRVGRATHLRFWGCVALLAVSALIAVAGVGLVATLIVRWLLS